MLLVFAIVRSLNAHFIIKELEYQSDSLILEKRRSLILEQVKTLKTLDKKSK